jgi:hypothetical protein
MFNSSVKKKNLIFLYFLFVPLYVFGASIQVEEELPIKTLKREIHTVFLEPDESIESVISSPPRIKHTIAVTKIRSYLSEIWKDSCDDIKDSSNVDLAYWWEDEHLVILVDILFSKKGGTPYYRNDFYSRTWFHALDLDLFRESLSLSEELTYNNIVRLSSIYEPDGSVTFWLFEEELEKLNRYEEKLSSLFIELESQKKNETDTDTNSLLMSELIKKIYIK